jgi:hypothetical protein
MIHHLYQMAFEKNRQIYAKKKEKHRCCTSQTHARFELHNHVHPPLKYLPSDFNSLKQLLKVERMLWRIFLFSPFCYFSVSR